MNRLASQSAGDRRTGVVNARGLIVALALLPALAAGSARAWEPVPPVDFSTIPPESIADTDLRFVLPLFHFHRLANAVVADGPNRGFINLQAWREPAEVQPHNARVLENAVALAFFYTVDRPWNPYRGSPAVKARLEAVLDFWVRSQSDKGLFAEYGPQQWSLAPTGYGVRAMTRTLELLAGGPPIDSELHARVIAAQRKAIQVMLTDERMLRSGQNAAEQFSAVFPAAISFGRLFPEHRESMDRQLRARLKQARGVLISPIGYPYQSGGPEIGYVLGIYLNILDGAWAGARGTEPARDLGDDAGRLFKWLSYNLLRDPEGRGLFVNAAIGTRTNTTFTPFRELLLAEAVESARPLAWTADEAKQEAERLRASLTRGWGKWPELRVPSAMSYPPTPFIEALPDSAAAWRPTTDQRAEALSAWPYLARDRFVEHATDARTPTTYTYIRRPGYYAGFASGKAPTERHRGGIGFLWHPRLGPVVQSQSGTDDQCWGTRAEGSPRPYEAADFAATFERDGKTAPKPPTGWQAMQDGGFSLRYPVGKDGQKTVVFDDDGIQVTVKHPDAFVEQIPILLRPSEQLAESAGVLTLAGGDDRFTVSVEGDATVEVKPTEVKVSDRRLTVIHIRGNGSLSYRMRFEATTN